jgi:hypothetical protein
MSSASAAGGQESRKVDFRLWIKQAAGCWGASRSWLMGPPFLDNSVTAHLPSTFQLLGGPPRVLHAPRLTRRPRPGLSPGGRLLASRPGRFVASGVANTGLAYVLPEQPEGFLVGVEPTLEAVTQPIIEKVTHIHDKYMLVAIYPKGLVIPNVRAEQAAAAALQELTDDQFVRVVKAEAGRRRGPGEPN